MTVNAGRSDDTLTFSIFTKTGIIFMPVEAFTTLEESIVVFT